MRGTNRLSLFQNLVSTLESTLNVGTGHRGTTILKDIVCPSLVVPLLREGQPTIWGVSLMPALPLQLSLVGLMTP